MFTVIPTIKIGHASKTMPRLLADFMQMRNSHRMSLASYIRPASTPAIAHSSSLNIALSRLDAVATLSLSTLYP